MNESDATAIFAPLWRRKWLILGVAVAVAAGSYFYYKKQTKLFQASTQIYLGAGAEEESAGGSEKTGRNASSSVANQVAVINSIVVTLVRQQLRAAGEANIARCTVKAKTAEKSEFITITAEAHTAKATARCANAVAVAYLKRQHADRRRSIATAIEIARPQLHRLEISSAAAPAAGSSVSKASGGGTSNVLQEAQLSSKINALEAQLSVIGAQQINPAHPAAAQLLSPKPRKNAIFGFVIGLLLAAIFAYVLARFDRRLRTLASIESIFGAPIVTALPTVKRPLVVRDGSPAPSKNLLEPVRRLHAALKLRPPGVSEAKARENGAGPTPQRAPRVILVTSAEVGDGKSTLVADLALVQRDAGERVAVIDANMRRPRLAKLLGAEQAQGLAEVLDEDFAVADAMQPVGPEPAGETGGANGGGVATLVSSRRQGSLSLLASGGGAANPPALLASDQMADLLSSLAEEFDFVLVDGPSPLEVSDVIPLLSLVDGVVVIARLSHTRDPAAERLAQLLRDDARAPLLGIVANCVPPKQIQRYGLSSSNGSSWARALQRR